MEYSLARRGSRDLAKRQRMESIALRLIDEGNLDELIDKLLAEKGLKERDRLWIAWKISQIQAGRNIIAIAQNGLAIMGVGDAEV